MQLSLEESKDLSDACFDASEYLQDKLENAALLTVGEIEAIERYQDRLSKLSNKLFEDWKERMLAATDEELMHKLARRQEMLPDPEHYCGDTDP